MYVGNIDGEYVRLGGDRGFMVHVRPTGWWLRAKGLEEPVWIYRCYGREENANGCAGDCDHWWR